MAPKTAHFAVFSRSASASTTKASAPPSSIVDFFSALPARRGDRPGAFRAGERHAVYARVVDDHLDLRAGGIEIPEGALGQARFLHQLLERRRALRHVACMLEKQRVAGGELRRDERAIW